MLRFLSLATGLSAQSQIVGSGKTVADCALSGLIGLIGHSLAGVCRKHQRLMLFCVLSGFTFTMDCESESRTNIDNVPNAKKAHAENGFEEGAAYNQNKSKSWVELDPNDPIDRQVIDKFIEKRKAVQIQYEWKAMVGYGDIAAESGPWEHVSTIHNLLRDIPMTFDVAHGHATIYVPKEFLDRAKQILLDSDVAVRIPGFRLVE